MFTHTKPGYFKPD